MTGSARTIPPPPVNPETKPFWDAAAQGRLLIKRCTACDEPHWYPRAICPFCGSERTDWMEASGHGTIYSYSVFRRAPIPYAIAYVTLAEGPTMMTNIVDCDLDAIRLARQSAWRSCPRTAGRRCRCSRRLSPRRASEYSRAPRAATRLPRYAPQPTDSPGCSVLPCGVIAAFVSLSYLEPQLDDLNDVDWKQHSVKQKHGIKVSCDAIEDEQDIACDRKPTQRHDSVHAKSREHGQRCQVSDKIDPGHWLLCGSNAE